VTGADDRVSQVPRPLLTACLILGLEVLGLLATVIVFVVESLTGPTAHLARGLVGAVFPLIAAAALALCARGLLRMRPAARTPVVVLELIALPIAYTIAFQANHVGYGGAILIAALAVLYLLFTPPVREVLDREDRTI
jgi:hypothetical protein